MGTEVGHASQTPVGEHLVLVNPREGYRKWSASYDDTPNPLLALESRVLAGILPPRQGLRILDAGCGTGRWMERLTADGAAVYGIDFCHEMIEQAARKPRLRNHCAVADICALPIRSCSFDLALCSFTLSYTRSIRNSIAELARIAGTLVVSDLHPEAIARGWRRSFRQNGVTWDIDHLPYTTSVLDVSARDAALTLTARIEAGFGEPEREIFRGAGKESTFAAAAACPAILISKWTR